MGYVDPHRSAKYGKEYYDHHFILLRSTEPDQLKRFYQRRFAYYQAYYAEKRTWQSNGETISRNEIRLIAMSEKVIGHEDDKLVLTGEPDEIMFIDRERHIIESINPKLLDPDQRVRLKSYHIYVIKILNSVPHSAIYRLNNRVLNSSLEDWYDFQTLMGLLYGQRPEDINEILVELTEQNIANASEPVMRVRLKKFRDYVTQKIDNNKQGQPGINIITEKHSEQGEDKPQNLQDLFESQEIMNQCIKILKNVDPPILNEKGEYIGNLKSAICVWVTEMRRKGLITAVNDATYAKLISKHLAPFSIEKSTFGKTNARAHDRYQLEMQTLLSKVSQERR